MRTIKVPVSWRHIIIASVLICASTQGQNLPYLASGALAFNLSIGEVYAPTNGFTAKTHVEYSDTNSQWSADFTFCQNGTNARCDFRVTEFGGPPEQAKQALRQLGLDELTALVNLSSNTLDVISPQLRSYLHIDAPPPLRKVLRLMSQQKDERVMLGDETLDGVQCKKVRIIDRESPDVVATAWLNVNGGNFPKRIDIVRGTEHTKIMIVSATLSAPNVDLMRVPGGYMCYTNSVEFLQAARVARERVIRLGK